MSGEHKLRACPLDSRVLEDAETDLVVADLRTHIGEEDARRLAACWNACAGLPVEALEAGVVAQALDMIAEAFAEPSCDGEEGLKDGMNCVSCRAKRLLKAAGRGP
jgi:hypothetical protein